MQEHHLKKKGLTTLKSIFSLEYFEMRFMRIVFPVIIIAVFSVVLGLLFKHNLYFGILTFIGRIPFEGFGNGWGNYFVSILIEFIIIFPFLYVLYLKSPKMMLIVTFILNLIFELFSYHSTIFYDNSYVYKASIFRYLFVMALGLWVMDKVDDSTKLLQFLLKYKFVLIGFILSVTYLLSNAFYKWIFPYFLPSWQPQNIFSAFYPLILCVIGIIYLPKLSSNKIMNFIAYIGKASYHIFLMQIIYFTAITPIIHNNHLIYGSISPILTIILITTNIIFSLGLSLIFFHLESKMALKIIRFPFRKNINNIYNKIIKNLIKKPEL
jgi:hypothetical protein